MDTRGRIEMGRLCFLMAVLALLAGSGCAFTEGAPWGKANFELRPGFDATGRKMKNNRVKTAKDYAIEVKKVALTVDSMTLLLAKGEDVVEGFDPAKPPEGYSLCHNGHCHATDGKIVPYAKVAAQLGVKGGGLEVVGVADQPVSIDLKTPLQVMTWADVVNGFTCADGHCDLPDASPTAVKLHVSGLTITGVAFDTTSKGRTPATGKTFTLTTHSANIDLSAVAKDLPVSNDITEVFGQLTVSPRIFDGIEIYQKAIEVGDDAVQDGLEFSLKSK